MSKTTLTEYWVVEYFDVRGWHIIRHPENENPVLYDHEGAARCEISCRKEHGSTNKARHRKAILLIIGEDDGE